MTNATLNQKIEKTAREMGDLVKRSKRKLLEWEVMMNHMEIERGKYSVYQSPEDLFKEL